MAKHNNTVDPAAVRDGLRVVPGPMNLLGYETDSVAFAPGGKAASKRSLAGSGATLASLQDILYANNAEAGARSVLLVLQGMDTSGKDGTVRHVVGLVGPAGVKITSFKKPTAAEAAHHFLWRIRRALPAPGIIGVFNRSHYEDVVTTRVHENISEDEWADRIGQINEFEQQLTDSGTVLVKCFLHISYAEQRRRLLARLDDETKLWKFNPGDIAERAYWSDYQAMYSAVMERTSTEANPWYVVPADAKWYRNWAIGQLLEQTLRDLDLSYPPASFDIEAARAQLQPPF